MTAVISICHHARPSHRRSRPRGRAVLPRMRQPRPSSGPFYACTECFGPLEVAYEFTSSGAALREQIEAGPQNIWRYAPLLPGPGRHRRHAEHQPGRHQAGPRRQPGPRAGHENAVGEGRFGQSDALVQGPGRRRRAGRGPRTRLQGARLPVDRQPGQRRRRGGRPGRHPVGRVRAVQPRAAEDPDHRRLRRHADRRRRQLRRHQPAGRRDRRRAGGLGVRQRQCPAVLRRGFEDAGLRGGRAARLAPAGADRRPDRLRRAAGQDRQGLQRAGLARPGRGLAVQGLRRPGHRLLPRVGRVQGRPRLRPAGAPGHHRQVAGHRQSRPTGRTCSTW